MLCLKLERKQRKRNRTVRRSRNVSRKNGGRHALVIVLRIGSAFSSIFFFFFWGGGRPLIITGPSFSSSVLCPCGHVLSWSFTLPCPLVVLFSHPFMVFIGLSFPSPYESAIVLLPAVSFPESSCAALPFSFFFFFLFFSFLFFFFLFLLLLLSLRIRPFIRRARDFIVLLWSLPSLSCPVLYEPVMSFLDPTLLPCPYGSVLSSPQVSALSIFLRVYPLKDKNKTKQKP